MFSEAKITSSWGALMYIYDSMDIIAQGKAKEKKKVTQREIFALKTREYKQWWYARNQKDCMWQKEV